MGIKQVILDYVSSKQNKEHGVSRTRIFNYFNNIYTRDEISQSISELQTEKLMRYENPTGQIYTTDM